MAAHAPSHSEGLRVTRVIATEDMFSPDELTVIAKNNGYTADGTLVVPPSDFWPATHWVDSQLLMERNIPDERVEPMFAVAIETNPAARPAPAVTEGLAALLGPDLVAFYGGTSSLNGLEDRR